MVKIHWSVYLIIGGVVLFISNRLNSQTDSRDFTLFIWIGYLLLVVGIAKLGIAFINKKKESKVERKEMKNFAYQQQPQQQPQQQQKAALYCPRCRTPLQSYDNFCSRCGQRIR